MCTEMKIIRIIPAALLAIILVVIAGACASGDNAETQQQLSIASELSTTLAQINGELGTTGGKLAGLQTRVSNTEGNITDFTATAAVHSLARTANITEPPAGKVALHFSFDYLPGSLPGDGLQVRTPSPEVNTLWAMESLPEGQSVPAGDLIKDNTIFLTPGESQMVTLVYQNPTAQDVGFLAMPHQESPGQLSAKTWLTCFCLAFIYEAPAEGAWYRVIRVAASPDMPPGSKVDALWTILTDPSVFPTD